MLTNNEGGTETMATKDEFLNYLNALEGYIESGIEDYLKDNSIDDYLEHGDGLNDFVLLDDVRRITAFVTHDHFPWYEGQYTKMPRNDPDPYSTATRKIREALEEALDDGVSGSMSEREFNNLDALARTLTSLDPDASPNPRLA